MFEEDAFLALGPCNVVCERLDLHSLAVGDRIEVVEEGANCSRSQQAS